MPIATENKNNLIAATLYEAFKARHGGGRGKGPGSRGGHFWMNASGHVEYGPKPAGSSRNSSSTHSSVRVATSHGAGSGGGSKPKRTGEFRPGYVASQQTRGAKLKRQKRMLREMDRVISAGKDPHGNKLEPKALEQLRFLATSLRTDLKGKELSEPIKSEITAKAADHLPFTVFKDVQGRYRWIGVSSSGAKDGDGETVATKALAADCVLKDITRSYGPLNWWHTNLKLGTCDYNAMDGPLLVESGTFDSDRVAVAIKSAIESGRLQPGMSLEFMHGEPGPQVLPGRVFKKINKVGRALLPGWIASNPLTSFEVYNQAAKALASEKEKESQKMLVEEKLKELESLLGPELVAGLLTKNSASLKAAEIAGLSFKAMTPPMEADVTNAAQLPTKKKVGLAAKADPLAPALVEGSPEEEAAETPQEEAAEGDEEGTYEDSPGDMEADSIMQGLYDQIDAIVKAATQATADKILAALAGVDAANASTKETQDALAGMTVALKENTQALTKVLGENAALKARLDALEGIQPPVVRARTSQSGGLTSKQLEPDHAAIVTTEKSVNPYEAIARQLGLTPAPRG